MTYAYEATDSHNEIAKHINKSLSKRLTGEQVAMVLEGAKDFRATAKERAEEAKNARKQAKIAALKAQLAELTGDEAETETVASVTPIKKAAATPPAKKAVAAPKTGAAKKTAAAAKDNKAAREEKVSEEEADVRLTPPGAEPIVVDVEEDGFETVGGETSDDDADWDDAFGDDEPTADSGSDAADF